MCRLNTDGPIDATPREMMFHGEIKAWGELQSVVRKHLIGSCPQHVLPFVHSTIDDMKQLHSQIERLSAHMGTLER